MAESEHSLRYIDCDSVIHRIYPLIKLIWVVVVAIGLFIYKEPLSGAIMLAAVLLTALIFARIPLRDIVDSSKMIFGLGILLMIFHFFADPGEPVFRIGRLTITDGGLHEGPIFLFRISVMVLASFVLIWTTDIRDLIVSMNKAGLPYRYAFTVFLALRFLPLVQREVDAVKSAHAIRGKASRSRLIHRFKLWQRYMFTVLINGLRKAEATATAIECRGFGTYPDRTYFKPVEFELKGILLVIIFILLQSSLIYAEQSL